MNMQQLRGFVSLENRKKDLDAELKSVKQQLDDLEEALVPQFIEDGVQRMTVDGRTVSIQQDVYASPLNDREDVVDALKQSELGQYVAEIQTALKHPKSQGLSDREIARHLGVHHDTVSEWRKRLEVSVGIRQIETRTATRQGATYEIDITNIGRQ